MVGIWHWEAPAGFTDNARLVDCLTATGINADQVALGFGKREPGDWVWVWLGEGPREKAPWSESFLVDAVSRVRIDAMQVGFLFGREFDPAMLVPGPAIVKALPDDRLLLDFAEAGVLFGITEAALRKRYFRGQVPIHLVKRTGDRVQFIRARVIEYLEGRKRA